MNIHFKTSAGKSSVWRIGLLIFLSFHALAEDSVTNKLKEVVTDTKPVIAPPASWVTPHFYDRQSLAAKVEANADQHWLLLERQVNADGNETFVHYSRQIMSVAGVQNGSTLKIDFNPSYATLTLHWVRIWRGADHLERLEPDKVRVVRQERGLDDQLLDGEQTALLVLDDVRVGDIVDYAYSIKGANPVFDGKFSSAVPLQLGEARWNGSSYRVLWPAQRRIYSKNHNCSLLPVSTTKSNSVECVWDLRQVPGFRTEDALPVWCDPEPWVQLSEFRTWAEVNQWALKLFQNNSPLSPELLQKIAGWKRLPDREQQVLAALRFVQDEVRYFGIEIGVSTEKPADPSSVFSKRYGDCKDKSLLFVTLVRGLGIEAYPVLVNTDLRRTIEDWQPTAGAFDHCISVVQLDGKTYWLDPTAGYQRGPLAMHYLPNYARGLVITPKTSALSIIPQTAGIPLTTTTEYFSMGDKDSPAGLKVVTVAEGRDADIMREIFATTKRTDIEKTYTHVYTDLYPGIRMASRLETVDNEQQNRFQTTEYYTIDNMWVRSDKGGKYTCQFYPYAMAALIRKPVDTQRRLPLGVTYPQHEILRTEATFPESWTLENRENKNIVDPAFTFRKESQRAGRKYIIQSD